MTWGVPRLTDLGSGADASLGVGDLGGGLYARTGDADAVNDVFESCDIDIDIDIDIATQAIVASTAAELTNEIRTGFGQL